METKRRISPLIPILIIIVILLAILDIKFYSDKVKAEKAYKELVEERQDAEKYQNNYNQLITLMINDAALAEECGNLITNVWHNAIFAIADEETNKYTMKNGEFVSDFNDALSELFSDEEFSTKMYDLSNNQSDVTSKMKRMTDPPDGYEEAYKALEDMYQSYIKLTDTVINCNGSLNSFNDDFINADYDVNDKYHVAELYAR